MRDTYIERALGLLPPRQRDIVAPHLISDGDTVLEALAALNGLSGGSLTLFVAGKDGRLSGTLTDGDIRRALIDGATGGDPVTDVMHRAFLAIRSPEESFTLFRQAKEKGIRLLPQLNDGYITNLYDLKKLKSILPLDAVLMAGGKGERLRPLTLDKPKPLLPVGGKPIIDYNVDELLGNGVKSIFVTVNYLKEQLIEHFRQSRYSDYVRCVAEPCRLGTIGSLSLVAPSLTHDHLLLMNSDLLTTLNLEAMYQHHLATDADVTIGGVPYTVSVPYAVMQTEGDTVVGLAEKPTFNYLANGGVYIMRRELTSLIPPGTFVDAPDFISELIKDGKKVGYFPIDGRWIDIGNPKDYEYADRLMSGA